MTYYFEELDEQTNRHSNAIVLQLLIGTEIDTLSLPYSLPTALFCTYVWLTRRTAYPQGIQIHWSESLYVD